MTGLNLISSKLGLLVMSCLWMASLTTGYIYYVLPIESMGWYALDDGWSSRLWIVSLVCLIGWMLPNTIAKPSTFFAYFFFVSIFTPSLLLAILQDEEIEFTFLICLAAMVLIFVSRLQITIRIPPLQFGSLISSILGVVALILLLVGFMSSGGPFNLDLFKVYELRSSGGVLSGGLWGYLVSNTAYAVAPFLLSLAVLKRSLVLGLVGMLSLALMFGFSGNKIFLVSIALVLFGALLFEFSVSYRRRLLFYGASILVLAATLISLQSESLEIVGSMFVRRIFFIPAQLNYYYYEFFSQNPHVYLSHLWPWLVQPPYEQNYGLLIGEYSGHPQANATNGFLGTSYMHFGVYGMVAFSLVIGALVKLTDSFSPDVRHHGFVVGATIVSYRVMLVESDLSTSLLTGGVLLSLFILWLYNSRVGSR